YCPALKPSSGDGYLMFSVIGLSNCVPSGPRSYTVPDTSLTCAGGLSSTSTVTAIACATDCAGTLITRFPPFAFTCPPLGVIQPPSRTVTSTLADLPSLVAVISAEPG